MLQVLRVLVHLLMPAVIGQIRQIARSGMPMGDVVGMLVLLVLFIMVTNITVKHNLDVLMKPQIVLEFELMTSLVVKLIRDVVGLIIRETVLVLMKPPVVLQVVVT